MNEQLYRKKGRRYIPIGYEDGWSGFPSEGIWLVTNGDGVDSSECIIKLGDVESLHPAVNLIYYYKDKIVKYLREYDTSGISLNEYVLRMLTKITE